MRRSARAAPRTRFRTTLYANSFVIWQLFTILVFIICVAIVLRRYSKKEIIRRIFKKIFRQTVDTTYKPSQYVVDQFADGHMLPADTLFYTDAAVSEPTALVVIVLGRSFMTTSPRNEDVGFANKLYEGVKTKCDLLVVGYPGRDDTSIIEILRHITNTVQEATAKKEYSGGFHFVGLSSGAMLAGAFIRKEIRPDIAKILDVPRLGLRICSFSSVCGIFTFNSLINPAIDAQIRRVILGPIRAHGIFDISSGFHNIPTCVITAKSDFLHSQSRDFIAKFKSTNYVTSRYVPHLFTRIVGLPEAQEATSVLARFIVAQRPPPT